MFNKKINISDIPCILCLFFILSIIPIFSFAQQTVNDETIISRYKQILLRNPKEGSTFDRLYHFYLEGDGLSAMLNDYQTEARNKPNDPHRHLILGHLYKRLGKDTHAITAYQRAVALAPDTYYTHFALGNIYKTLRNYEAALKALQKAAELSEFAPNIPLAERISIYQALGTALFHRDFVDEAIQAWHKIAEMDPQDIFARLELAELFKEKQLYPQAIAQHEAILKLKKDDPYRACLSYRAIGNILEIKGDFQAALNSYETALALTAQGNWLRKDIQHRIIGIFASTGNWEGLIKHYTEKLEETPSEPELLGLLAAA